LHIAEFSADKLTTSRLHHIHIHMIMITSSFSISIVIIVHHQGNGSNKQLERVKSPYRPKSKCPSAAPLSKKFFVNSISLKRTVVQATHNHDFYY